MADSPGPFVQSRLKSYTARLDAAIDVKLALANSLALSPATLFAPLAAYQSSPNSKAALPPVRGNAGSSAWQQGGGSTPSTKAALADIELLKSEIAGVESVLSFLKGADEMSVSGRRHQRLSSQAQLKARAAAVTRSLNELPLTKHGGMSGSLTQPSSTSAGLLSITAGGASSGSLSTGASPRTVQPLLSPSQQLPGTSGRSSPVQLTLVPGPGGALVQAPPLPAPDHAFESLASQLKRANQQPGGSAFNGTASGGGAVPADSTPSHAWRGVPRGVVPVGRGEAVILEAALDEALPQGAITAKYATSSTAALAAAQATHASISPAQAYLESQDIRQDYELLDTVMREAARQVAGSCAERGRLLLKIGERYQEVFSALVIMVATQHAAAGMLASQLDDQRAQAAKQASAFSEIRSALERQLGEIEERESEITALRTELEHVKWDSEQMITELREQNTILATEVEARVAQIEDMEVAQEEALRAGLAELQAKAEAAVDERDDLAQRIRFLEKQLIALRHEAGKSTPVVSSWAQTEPVQFLEEGGELGGGMPVDEGQALQTTSLVPAAGAKTKRKRTRRLLGGFEGMITLERPGRIRGITWTTNALAQIYYDKTLHDVVCDRESNPRSRICDFTFDWHLNRYGLRHLAEGTLLDLIASTRHHSKTSQGIRWFAQFTGLLDLGDAVDTPQHLSFYLFTLQQLAFPASLFSLFADNEDQAVLTINAAALPEVCKAVFRYLNDGDAYLPFLQRHQEHLASDPLGKDNKAALAPLVRAFMGEYQRRVDRNVAHLRALFRAADSDEDGLISYDQMATALRLAAPDINDRLLTKMYSEAVRHLPPGQYLIPLDHFVDTARTFGFDRWRVDPLAPGTLAGLEGDVRGGALLAQGPGVLSLLGRSRTSSPEPGLDPLLGPWPGSEAAVPSPLSQAPTTAAAAAQAPNSPARRIDSARDSESKLWRLTQGHLERMEVPLSQLLQAARDRLGAASPTVQHMERQLSVLERLLDDRASGRSETAFNKPFVSRTVQLPGSSLPVGGVNPLGAAGGPSFSGPSQAGTAGTATGGGSTAGHRGAPPGVTALSVTHHLGSHTGGHGLLSPGGASLPSPGKAGPSRMGQRRGNAGSVMPSNLGVTSRMGSMAHGGQHGTAGGGTAAPGVVPNLSTTAGGAGEATQSVTAAGAGAAVTGAATASPGGTSSTQGGHGSTVHPSSSSQYNQARSDAAQAWLTLRLLYAGLVAALATPGAASAAETAAAVASGGRVAGLALGAVFSSLPFAATAGGPSGYLAGGGGGDAGTCGGGAAGANTGTGSLQLTSGAPHPLHPAGGLNSKAATAAREKEATAAVAAATGGRRVVTVPAMPWRAGYLSPPTSAHGSGSNTRSHSPAQSVQQGPAGTTGAQVLPSAHGAPVVLRSMGATSVLSVPPSVPVRAGAVPGRGSPVQPGGALQYNSNAVLAGVLGVAPVSSTVVLPVVSGQHAMRHAAAAGAVVAAGSRAQAAAAGVTMAGSYLGPVSINAAPSQASQRPPSRAGSPAAAATGATATVTAGASEGSQQPLSDVHASDTLGEDIAASAAAQAAQEAAAAKAAVVPADAPHSSFAPAPQGSRRFMVQPGVAGEVPPLAPLSPDVLGAHEPPGAEGGAQVEDGGEEQQQPEGWRGPKDGLSQGAGEDLLARTSFAFAPAAGSPAPQHQSQFPTQPLTQQPQQTAQQQLPQQQQAPAGAGAGEGAAGELPHLGQGETVLQSQTAGAGSGGPGLVYELSMIELGGASQGRPPAAQAESSGDSSAEQSAPVQT